MTIEPMCIGTAFLAKLEEAPDETFIIQNDIKFSRLEFARNAAAMRSFFEREGIGPQSVVGLANTNQVTTFEAIFALWSLGSTPIILDFRMSADEQKHLAKAAGITHIFSDFKRLVNNTGISLLPRSDSINGDVSELTFSVGPQEFAESRQSSGTTALPKIKQISKGRLFQIVSEMCRNTHRGQKGNIVSCLNLSFPATRFLWYRNTISGRKIISLPPFFKFSELDTALLHSDAEEVTLAPVLIANLVTHLKQTGKVTDKPRYPNLIKFQSIGGPLVGKALLEAKRALSGSLSVTYSSSETGVISRLEAYDMKSKPNSVGRPIPDISVTIISGANEPMPIGRVGDICVSIEGKNIFPNDLGFIDHEGFLHVTGRSGNNLCRNGVSFAAEDVEKRIRSIEGVNDCCVFSIPAKLTGEDEVAVAIEGDPELAPDIKARLRLNMLALTRPQRIWVSNRLPRTSGMKIARAKLQRQYLVDPGSYDDV